MNYIKELFSDVGTASIARVLVALCYVTACAIAVASLWMAKEHVGVVATLLTAGTILKVGQKALEKGE